MQHQVALLDRLDHRTPNAEVNLLLSLDLDAEEELLRMAYSIQFVCLSGINGWRDTVRSVNYAGVYKHCM